MPSLKSDTAFATNLLQKDPTIRTLMAFDNAEDRSKRVVPMRQQPNEAANKPLISVWIRPVGNLGGKITSNILNVDIYTPLTTQRKTGVGHDIARRVKEVLDKQPIGRRLDWLQTDPDVRSTTGWHKANVQFGFRSTQY